MNLATIIILAIAAAITYGISLTPPLTAFGILFAGALASLFCVCFRSA